MYKKRKLSANQEQELSTPAAAASPAAGVVIAHDDHADRQWTPAMLSNLHYAAATASRRKYYKPL